MRNSKEPKYEKNPTRSRLGGMTVWRPVFTGFTLMEIIIVISVVLILAVLGIGSYGVARRAIAIDLETDKLVAALASAREESKIGLLCRGFLFKKNTAVQKIEAAYRNPVLGCDNNYEKSAFPASAEVAVAGLTEDDAAVDEFSVIFAPPLGKMQIRHGAKTAEITLALKTGPNARRILLNSETGKIEKLTARPNT